MNHLTSLQFEEVLIAVITATVAAAEQVIIPPFDLDLYRN